MKLNTISLLIICLLSFIISRRKFKNKSCNLYTDKMSDEDKAIIVSTHNEYRNQVALGTSGTNLAFATNMIQMYWSEELAVKAQEWADKCRARNSSNRAHPKFKVGENIHKLETTGGDPKPEWKKSIDAWFAQSKSFDGKSIKKFRIGGVDTGSFTQLIWANSYWVGCGFAKFKTVKNTDMSFYVCHYGPKGNNLNLPIYSDAQAAGCTCLSGISCGNAKYKGLCCPSGYCEEKNLVYGGEPFPGTTQ